MSVYALCVGINAYEGAPLAGCVNDARDFADEWTRRGADTELLLDHEATKAEITSAVRSMLHDAKSGDTVLFTYSGHGTRVPDRDGDEPDRWDEALVPVDYRSAGLLVDDDVHELFAERNRGTRVVMVSDSCHSGSVTRFADALGDSQRRVKFLPPEVVLPPEDFERARTMPIQPKGTPRYTSLLMSGCADPEYSYDTSFDGRPNGAFTYVALNALRSLPTGASFRDWHRRIREALPSQDYPQTPAIYGTSRMRRWTLP